MNKLQNQKFFITFFAAIKRSVSPFQGLSTVQISYSKFENESYIIKLSFKGEINSGGYILRPEVSRGIYLVLFTDPDGVVVLVYFTKSVGLK